MRRTAPIVVLAVLLALFSRADLNISQPSPANLSQIGGVSIATGTGASGAGVARVTVANDSNLLATESGTWTVQPGNTPNTSAWLVDHQPITGTGDALSSSAKSAVTASVNVKASAGNVYGVLALNGAASTCWLQFINSATAGTLGTSVIFSVPLPASITQPVYVQPAPFALSNFSSGIAVGIATTATGSSACGTAGNLTVFYK